MILQVAYATVTVCITHSDEADAKFSEGRWRLFYIPWIRSCCTNFGAKQWHCLHYFVHSTTVGVAAREEMCMSADPLFLTLYSAVVATHMLLTGVVNHPSSTGSRTHFQLSNLLLNVLWPLNKFGCECRKAILSRLETAQSASAPNSRRVDARNQQN